MLKRFKNAIIICCIAAVCFLFGCQSNKLANTNSSVNKNESTEPTKSVQTVKKTEFTTKEGMVRTDGKESTILSLNEETGDLFR